MSQRYSFPSARRFMLCFSTSSFLRHNLATRSLDREVFASQMEQIGLSLDNSLNHNVNEKVTNILAPFNPISESAMKVALQLLELDAHDVLFDLGAGDGRLLVHAAQSVPHLRCVGIEIDAKFVDRAEISMEKLSVDIQEKVQMRLGDALAVAEYSNQSTAKPSNRFCDDLTIYDATALFLFLVPNGLKLISPLLQRVVERNKSEGRPFRVVAYMFHVPGWEPTVVNRNTKAGSPVYLYQF
jgi:hypothetical protein